MRSILCGLDAPHGHLPVAMVTNSTQTRSAFTYYVQSQGKANSANKFPYTEHKKGAPHERCLL